MARTLKPYGVNIDYNISDEGAAHDHIIVNLFKRVEDGDNEVVGRKTYIFAELPSNIQRMVSVYGLSKVVQDRTSDESGEEGRLDSMDAVISRFMEGHWEKERESTGPTVRIEVEALAAIKGVSVSAIQKALRSYDAEAREKILSSKAVQDKVEELKSQTSESDELSLEDLAA